MGGGRCRSFFPPLASPCDRAASSSIRSPLCLYQRSVDHGHESDEEDFGQAIGETESAQAAIDLAGRELGADPARWVNQGVLQDEYNDYLKQGRPLGRWQPS